MSMMLSLYLETRIIGHKFCSVLSIQCKLNIAKFYDKSGVFNKKIRTQQQQNKKENIKILARTRNQTLKLLHRKLMRYI